MAKKQAKKDKDVSAIVIEKTKPVQAESEPQNEVVRIRCVFPFHDARTNIDRYVGDEWDATRERVAEINKVAEAVNTNLIEVL